MDKLLEYSRSELLAKSKKADNYKDQSKGKNRFERRKHSSVANSVKEFNKINMNKLFKDGILDVDIRVKGETDNYLVKLSFGSFLDSLQGQLHRANADKVTLRLITRALVDAFNSDNVYISCSCPDWRYRMGYWATINDINSGDAESRPSDITNPNDTKGSGCKHSLLVLSNNSWLMKVASVIHNYINWMEAHQERLYQDVIYPALYVKEFELDDYEPEDTQISLDDIENVEVDASGDVEFSDELASEEDDLDISNRWAETKNRFKVGNQSGVQFAKKDDNNEQTTMAINTTPRKRINFDDLISDTNPKKDN